MQDAKLYKWLIRLDKAEQNAFVRYVEALGGKNREELGRMAKLFVKKVVRGKGMAREAFYVAMDWPLPYNAGLLLHRLTDLKKRLEAFLAVQVLRGDALAVAAYHVKAMEGRGWADLVRSEVKSAREIVQSAPADVGRFLHAMQLEESYLNATMEAPRKFKEASFQVPMQHLEDFFCLQKLRYGCAAHTQEGVQGNIAHDYGLLDQVIAYLRPRLDALPQVLRMYYHLYHMLHGPAEGAHFQALRGELQGHWQELSAGLAREFYTYLSNHCSKRINAGELAFYDELERIYEETMASGALLSDGMIEPGMLKNMVGVMIRSGKLEVAERLIDTYSTKLTPEADPVTCGYLRAIMDYHRGDFSKARKGLEWVLRDAKDVFFKMDAKVYSWRASYELGDLDLSEDNYHALRMYLQRDKLLPKGTRDNYLQFLNGLHSLLGIVQEDCTPEKRRRKLLVLQAKLLAFRSVSNILWLRQKVERELGK